MTGYGGFRVLTAWKGVLEMDEICTISLEAGGTETAVARVFSDVVVVVTFVAFVTEVRFVEEGRVGSAAIVVIVV